VLLVRGEEENLRGGEGVGLLRIREKREGRRRKRKGEKGEIVWSTSLSGDATWPRLDFLLFKTSNLCELWWNPVLLKSYHLVPHIFKLTLKSMKLIIYSNRTYYHNCLSNSVVFYFHNINIIT
jgi:hypothetical protein